MAVWNMLLPYTTLASSKTPWIRIFRRLLSVILDKRRNRSIAITVMQTSNILVNIFALALTSPINSGSSAEMDDDNWKIVLLLIREMA